MKTVWKYLLIFGAGLGIALLGVLFYAKKFIPGLLAGSSSGDRADDRRVDSDRVGSDIDRVGDGLSAIADGAGQLDAGADHIANGINRLRSLIQKLREDGGNPDQGAGADQFIP